MLSEKEKIDKVFRPYYSEVTNAIEMALSDWRQHAMLSMPHISPAAKSVMINDYVHEKLVGFSTEHPGYSTITEQRGFSLIYNDQYALRPKKVSRKLRSGNIPTKRVDAIKDQEYFLPGLENNMIFLTLGYHLSPFYELKGVFFIMEDHDGAVWHIRIDNTIEEEKQGRLPIWETDKTETNKRVRVRPKREVAQVSENIKEA